MIKEEQTLVLELHEDVRIIPIVPQKEIIEDKCYHDQQTPKQEAPFFIFAVSPLTESEIDLLLNINNQVNSSKFDEDLQQPCQSLCNQDYNDCPSSGFSDLSSPQSLFQKDNIQEVDQLVEKQGVLTFSFTDNNKELFDSPTYDEYDDDHLEQSVFDTSSEGEFFQEAWIFDQLIDWVYWKYHIT